MQMETQRWCVVLTLTVHDYSTMSKLGWFPDDIWKASKQEGWDMVSAEFAKIDATMSAKTGVRLDGTLTQSHIEQNDGKVEFIRFWIRSVREPGQCDKVRYESALSELVRALQVRFPESNAAIEENSIVLDSRIRFVLDVAAVNGVKTLILGAFGCGVFGQDPVEVASTFKKYLPGYLFDTIVFAVPDKASANYRSFSKVFS